MNSVGWVMVLVLLAGCLGLQDQTTNAVQNRTTSPSMAVVDSISVDSTTTLSDSTSTTVFFTTTLPQYCNGSAIYEGGLFFAYCLCSSPDICFIQWDRPITTTTTTTTTTTVTFKLKHQGSFSEHHPTTTTIIVYNLSIIYDFMLQCQNDSDCGLANDCCGCYGGGRYYAMNKVYVKSWERNNQCPISVHCFGSMKPCESYRSRCVNSTCRKVLE